VVKGDSVEFELIESNPILKAIGLDSVRHYPRFIFKDGLILRKEPWKVSPDIQERNLLAGPMRKWKKENYPDIVARFFDSKGNFIFNEENGRLQVQLAEEWKRTIHYR
jgi:hypothetical protein